MNPVRFFLQPLLLVFLLSAGFAPLLRSQQVFFDDFESLARWRGIHTHGDACTISLGQGTGTSGKCMTAEYAFQGHMGSVAAEGTIHAAMPAHYQLSFDIKGKGLPNNLIIRLIDSLGNVWIVINSDYVLPREWTTMRIRQNQIQYGWGPSGGGPLKYLERVEIIIDVVDGGAGTFAIDNFTVGESGVPPPGSPREFFLSPNDSVRQIAKHEPRGSYPRPFLDEQSYWTVVGAPRDSKEALLSEDGMIEVDRRSFSLEPFLFLDGRLVTWADVATSQSLENGFLPIPTVVWERAGGARLAVTAFAAGPEGKSVLVARYCVTNHGAAPLRGKLFIAARPFQVNPPWQTFTIVGGISRMDDVRANDRLSIDGKLVFPISPPEAAGVTAPGEGDVITYLRQGRVPPPREARDPSGRLSAALQYPLDLAPGDSQALVLLVPFHDQADAPASLRADGPGPAYNRMHAETARLWKSKLGRVSLQLPPVAGPVAATIRSAIAYACINADGPALQPGSRSYERSWIRDGALIAAAMLSAGVTDEVRAYLDWYAGFQFPDGKIPCVVDSRGAEPIPENDAPGQFIYAIQTYFRFTQDTTWLRGKWDAVRSTVKYIRALRAERKTGRYLNGTPLERACYGLVPESISHEGYSPQPMHSYWDDFFVVRGLEDGVTIARALGKRDDASVWAAEWSDMRTDLFNSVRSAMRIHAMHVIPGCVELGDIGGLSTTVALLPCNLMGQLPEPELHNSFDQYFNESFLARKNRGDSLAAYLPYEARCIGAYVLLGQKDRALAILESLMADRRPSGWNHWAEVVHAAYRAPKNIGDMPHSWVGTDFVRSVRTMLVYEDEQHESLVVGAGIPASWVNAPEGVAVHGMPTYYGTLNYSMKKSGNRVIAELSGTIAVPPGHIVVHSPLSAERVIVEKLPARIELR